MKNRYNNNIHYASITFLLIFFFFWFFFLDKNIKIPIHYDLNGNVTNYGSTIQNYFIFAINLIIIIFIFFLSKTPEKLNYPFEIKEETKINTYNKMRFFLSILSISITLLFGYSIYSPYLNILLDSKSIFSIIIFFSIIPLILILILKNDNKKSH
jgi:hypothetical protein